MRSLLTYTVARLGLFAAAFGVVYLFGARSWVAVILAWLISGLASYVLLSKMRDKISASAVERMEKRRGNRVSDRLEAAAAREDDLQEEASAVGAADGRSADGDESAGDASAAEPQERDEDAPAAARES